MFDIDAIRARCEAATPDPWVWWCTPDTPPVLVHPRRSILIVMDAVRKGMQGAAVRFATRGDDDEGGIMNTVDSYAPAYDRYGTEFRYDIANPDAQFIAHARADLPKLLAANDQLRAENCKMKEVLREIRTRCIEDCADVIVAGGLNLEGSNA